VSEEEAQATELATRLVTLQGDQPVVESFSQGHLTFTRVEVYHDNFMIPSFRHHDEWQVAQALRRMRASAIPLRRNPEL
jgi:hypothetical protein